MNRKLLTGVLIVVGWLAGARCYARTAIDPATLMETPFEQAANLAASEDRIAPSAPNLQEMFARKYGSRAERLLGDEGEDFLGIPGVQENAVRAANLNNASFSKGYLRNHLYAREVYGDEDFELLAADRPVETQSGKTDMDLVFRDRASGQEFRMEVKAVQEKNLARNMEKYKIQIDKMAEDAEVSGREQVWVNRYGVPQELRDYAEARGVRVFDNVATGEKSLLRPGTRTMSGVLDELKGGSEGLAGPEGLGAEGSAMKATIAADADFAAQGGSGLVGGATESLVADAAEGSVEEGALAEVESLAVVAGDAVTEGAAVGAGTGTLTGPEGTVAGGVIGVVVGAVVGVSIATVNYAVDSYHQFEDNKFGRHQQAELMQFLTHYYSKPVAAAGK